VDRQKEKVKCCR